MTKGKKHDTGKPMLSLTPVEFIIGVAEAFTFGAKKYDAHNFKQGIETQRLLDAALRHTYLELSGVEIDEESGLEHWKLAGASMAMYAYMKANKPDMDTRYKPSKDEVLRIVASMYGE